MASNSAAFYGVPYAQYQTLYLDFAVKSQNIENNTTTFEYKVYANGAGVTSYGCAYSISGAYSASASGLTWAWPPQKIIREGTFVVTHNADGTLSNQTLSVTASFVTYDGTATASTSVTISVPTIPRATTPSAPNGTMGSALTISTPRASSAFTHRLRYKFGAASGTIANDVGTSHSWTPPLTLANQIPRATSGQCTIYCDTYNGSNLIGTKSIQVTLSVPSTVVPSISSITQTEAVSGLAAKFGGFVRHKSKIRIRTTASGDYGSTISSISVGIDGNTYSGADITTGIIKAAAGTYSQGLVVTVTDSRGRKTTGKYSVTILDWSSPRIISFSAVRTNASGVATDDGWNARIYYRYSIAPVDDKNNNTWAVHRLDGSSWVAVSSGTGYSANTNFISGALFNPDNSYMLRLTVTDYFGSVYSYFTIPTSSNVMDIKANKKGLAIGKASELDGLECAWPAYFTGGLQSNGSPVITEASNSLLAGKLHWTGTSVPENVIKNKWDTLPMTIETADIYLVRASGSNLALAVVIKTSAAGTVLLVKAGQSIRMDYDGSTWS